MPRTPVLVSRTFLAVAGLATGLAACDMGGSKPVETVPPATGEALAEFSANITDRADRRKDAALYEYFCMTALGEACPSDLDARLAPYQIAGAGTRLNVAYAFTQMRAVMNAGDPDAVVSDEQFLQAAYQVALGREPDPGGAADHLRHIKSTGERQGALRAMLQSLEFRSR